ncbi:CDP-glycerol glycerophosphotransferase family protein [Enterococcus thailandicus]|uniref:CDP-glycerol glycerophosphotransferase family protein n=1 Tax=Enterococcus TaxID=1350 RepID=UPI0032E438A3
MENMTIVIYPHNSWGQLNKTLNSVKSSIKSKTSIVIVKNEFYDLKIEKKVEKLLNESNLKIEIDLKNIKTSTLVLHAGDTILNKKILNDELIRMKENKNQVTIFKTLNKDNPFWGYEFKKIEEKLIQMDELPILKADLDSNSYLLSAEYARKLKNDFYKNPIYLLDNQTKILYSNQILLERAHFYEKKVCTTISEYVRVLGQIIEAGSWDSHSKYLAERLLNCEIKAVLQLWAAKKEIAQTEEIELKKIIELCLAYVNDEILDLEAFVLVKNYLTNKRKKYKKVRKENIQLIDNQIYYIFDKEKTKLENHYRKYYSNIHEINDCLDFRFAYIDEVIDSNPKINIFFRKIDSSESVGLNSVWSTKNNEFIVQSNAKPIHQDQLEWDVDVSTNQFIISEKHTNELKNLTVGKYVLGINKQYINCVKETYIEFQKTYKLTTFWIVEDKRYIFSIDANGYLILDVKKNEYCLNEFSVFNNQIEFQLLTEKNINNCNFKLMNKKTKKMIVSKPGENLTLEEIASLPDGVYNIYINDMKNKYYQVIGKINSKHYLLGNVDIKISNTRYGSMVVVIRRVDAKIKVDREGNDYLRISVKKVSNSIAAPILLKIKSLDTGKTIDQKMPESAIENEYTFSISLSERSIRNAGLTPIMFVFYEGSRELTIMEEICNQESWIINDYKYTIYPNENGLKLAFEYIKELNKYENYKLKNWDYLQFQKLPVEKNTVFFESFSVKTFSDNPKAIYDYMRLHYPDYDFIWGLSDTRQYIDGEEDGTRKVKVGTTDYYKKLATTEYFVSNYNAPAFQKREGQVDVQTMHGTPLKKMGFDVMKTNKSKKMLKRVVGQWDLYTSSSTYLTNILRGSSFNYKGEILDSGYPRNDYLFDAKSTLLNTEKIRKQLNISKEKKIILYAPTWRTKTKYDQKLALDKLKKNLSEEYVLVYRTHYLVEKYIDPEIYDDFVIDGHSIKDVKELLVATDLLITDYSSIMFDYSILNRPMLFFTYDYEQYINKLRGTYFDLREEFPALIAETNAELINKIKKVNQSPEIITALEKFRLKFNEFERGNASCQIVEAMINFKK